MIDIQTDSRKIKQGDTFIALRGVDHDGHDYIEQAIKNGATKIICEEGNYPVETVIVKDTRTYLEKYLKDNYYSQIKDIKLIGITGTNGKTTTCYFVYQMLKALGKEVAYIGTIGFYLKDEVEELVNTTPDIMDLYNIFLRCQENKVEYIVMEVSSQALDMRRVETLLFDVVGFTNLTQDHLDYHQNMANYIKAKQILFQQLKNKKTAIINIDSDHYQKYLKEENNNITFGKNKSDAMISDVNLTNQGLSFNLKYQNHYKIDLNIVGEFNIYNYVMALITLLELGFKIEEIIPTNKNLTPPPGRMELVKYKSSSIFVDYAHTPDAVINVLESAEKYKTNKIITVIGCGGNRDRTKRPLMGEAAVKYSDYVIFTNDNPRCEDEQQIMNDIVSNLSKDNYEIIHNREEAIFKAMSLLTNNDIVFILGKGHEETQTIGKEHFHFSDKETVLKWIKKNN